VNIGNPGEFTILELAEKVREKVNPNVKIVFKEAAADDPKQRKPDITKAKKILGWEPLIPLDEGLEKTIPYFATMVEEKKLSGQWQR
jgi:UDP-glucuronate decarboxylase